MSTPSPDDLAALSAAWRAFGSKGNGRPMSTSPDDSGALSPAERDFALRRMPVDPLAESYAAARDAASRPVTNAAALIEWDVMHGALMELHSVAYTFFLLKRRAPNSPVAEAADALFALENKLREALK